MPVTEIDHNRALYASVHALSRRTVISEWVTARPLSDLIARGDQVSKDTAASLLFEFCGASMSQLGALHADPHPGNYQLTDDGRLVVLDFGAVASVHRSALTFLDTLRLAEVARSVELSDVQDPQLQTLMLAEVASAMRAIGFSATDDQVQSEDVLSYFGPFAEPLWTNRFQFNRPWMENLAPRIPGLARGQDFLAGSALTIPTEHVLMFRTLVGVVAVACQLEAEVALREIVIRWYPGFEDPKLPQTSLVRSGSPASCCGS